MNDSPPAIPCPACLAPAAAFAFQKSGYDLFRCAACSFLFVHPFPTDAELDAHYARGYRAATADFYPKSRSRRWRAFMRSLKLLPYVMRKDVLDIGCGGGFMAEAFARVGARATGIDVSQDGIAYARNHFPQAEFHCESLADFRKRGRSFDFVFSSEVLEHLPGPGEFMRTLQAATRPGGFAYVSAPDAGHPATPERIEEWTDICPPEHLEFFNAQNLAILFERYGFRRRKAFHNKTPAHSVIFQRIA